MRVGLNATCFNERPSGAKQRFLGIYGELIRRRPDISFVIYEPADCAVSRWFGNAANVSVRRTPLPSFGRVRRLRQGLGYWRKALAADALDLFETFNLPLVRAPDCPTVLTIHDLRSVRKDVPVLLRLMHAAVVNHALTRADHVVAVSNSMKAELLKLRPGTSVSTIYNGTAIRDFSGDASGAADALRRKLSLPGEFILAIGHLEARKNYPTLLEAIAKLAQGGKIRPLVIVGNDGGDARAIALRIDQLGLADQVTILSGRTDDEVHALYALCCMAIFPSLYEGFGIPIIEAMAARRPIVLSDIPVFREITEDRGIYFPPTDSDAMASAIDQVWTSRQDRDRLVSYGDERVQAFGFATLTDQIEQLHQSLLAADGG